MQHGLRYVNKLAILYISVYTRLNFESYLKMLKPEEHWRPLDPVLHTCTTFSWLGRLFRKSFICCRVQKSCNMLSTQMHALEQAYAVHYVSDKLASTWRYQKQAINARASLSAMLWWLMTMYFLKFIVDFHQIHANACWLPSENNRYSLLCHYCKRSAQKTAPNLISLSLSPSPSPNS